MISFRYHLVSIVGIFLALALGIVVGTTALNGPITKELRNKVDDVTAQRDKLADQTKALQGQVDDADKFASTYGAQLVASALTKQSVVMLSLPGASSQMVDGVAKQVTNAGGTVTGRVSLTDDYLDRSNSSGIVTLATGAARPIGWQAPETSDAGQLGGSLLAYVLLGKGQKSDLSQVLGGLSELHMVQASANVTSATNVIVVGKGAHLGTYGGNVELALVGALSKAGGHLVVAGDSASAESGGLVALIRDADAVRSGASTVDNADTSFGQVSSVLALSNAIKGESGQYGTQNGADALFPPPAS